MIDRIQKSRIGSTCLAHAKHITPITSRFIQIAACAALLLFIGTGNVWGTTGSMNYTVYLQQGKGTVQAEVWTWRTGKDDTQDAVASTSTPGGSATASLDNSDTKYWKFRVPLEGQNPGYTFDGWYTDEACTKNKKTDNPYGSRSLTADRSKTVYAKFTPNNYSITLNDNGGNGGDGTHAVTFDAATGSLTNVPARTGYTFTGYYTSSGIKIFNADLTPIQNVSGYTDNLATKPWIYAENITLYAHWTANTYSVSLDNEGGSPSSSSVTLTYDSNSHASITNPTKTNYTFAGWWTGDNGTGDLVIAADGTMQANVSGYTGADGIWTKTTATTLYAKWILNSDKTITLDNQDATTAGTESMTVRFKTSNYSTGSTSISVPAKTGYTFDGYYTTVDGDVQVIDEDGSIIASVTGYTDGDINWVNGDEETILYAHWTGISYSVRFNGNTSTTGSMSNQAFVYGTAQNLTANGFGKTCTVTYNANGGSCGLAWSTAAFAFEGWATSSEGDVLYANSAEVNNLTTTSGAVVDLYAKWSATADTVVLPSATKTGDYPFAGWYDADENFIGNAGDSITPSGDITLFAHWTPYTITKNSEFADADGKYSYSWEGIHCTFTISSKGILTYTAAGAEYSKHVSIGKDDLSAISWTPKNTDCEITVTYFRVVCGNPGGSRDIYVNGSKYGTMSTWATNYKVQGEVSAGTSDSIFIKGSDVIDIYSIELWYTVTPKTPTPHDARLNATLNESYKQTVSLRVNNGVGAIFTMADPASDFTYTYQLGADYGTHAHIEIVGGDTLFWADETGDYLVQARVNSEHDHEASGLGTATIHVTRVCEFWNKKGDKNWRTEGNWLHNGVPTTADSVRVFGQLTLDSEKEVRGLAIVGDTAKVIIASTGGLTIDEGGITGATTSNLKLATSDGTDSGVKGQTGYLRLHPSCSMPQATVELYSIAYANMATQVATWQYMGIPVAETLRGWSFCDYGQQFVYGWSETAGWYDCFDSDVTPFKGYCLTQMTDGGKFTFTGTLVAANDAHKSVALTCNGSAPIESRGLHVLANSYAAPIDITKFETSDFGTAIDGTIYLFNTGSENDVKTAEESGSGAVSAENDAKLNTAGYYIAVTPGTAASIHAKDSRFPLVIPSMQGFYLKVSKDTTFTMDYTKLVWNATNRTNTALRAPSRRSEENSSELNDFLKVTISDGTAGDYLYLLTSEQYDKSYENGYDASKMMSDDQDLPNVFAVEADKQLAIDATSDFEGTFIGVRTGKETNYTLYFSHLKSETTWALLDTYTQQTIDINEGTSYQFAATPHTMLADRFQIIESENGNNTTTAVDEVTVQNKNKKFIYNGHLMILKDGVLYNASGQRVR